MGFADTFGKLRGVCIVLSRRHGRQETHFNLHIWCVSPIVLQKLPPLPALQLLHFSLTDETGYTGSTAVSMTTGCQPWHQQKSHVLPLFVLRRWHHATSAMFPFSATFLIRCCRYQRSTLAAGFSAASIMSLCGHFNHHVKLKRRANHFYQVVNQDTDVSDALQT